VVGGGGWWWVVVCKPNLVFYFGPNQALGLGMGLGPSRTKIGCGTASGNLVQYYCSFGQNKKWTI
jgi:hypothetical protein